MIETLTEFMARKHDPKWKPPKVKQPRLTLRKFPRNDVADDMDTYQYQVSFDYRYIKHPDMLTLDEWLESMMQKPGRKPPKPFKMPKPSAVPKLTVKQRSQDIQDVLTVRRQFGVTDK